MAQKHIVLQDGDERLYLQWESKTWFPEFRAPIVFRPEKSKAAGIAEEFVSIVMWRAKRYCKDAGVAPKLQIVPR